MELEGSNPNGCNVIINNQNPIIFFFPKNVANWVKGLQSLF